MSNGIHVSVTPLVLLALGACGSQPLAIVPPDATIDSTPADGRPDASPTAVDAADVTPVPGMHCRADGDCPGGTFCGGPLRCGPDGVCGYYLVRLPCNDDQRCTDDVCDEATRACSYVRHPDRCPAGADCVPYRGCVVLDGGA